jgi:hypothetical protein
MPHLEPAAFTERRVAMTLRVAEQSSTFRQIPPGYGGSPSWAGCRARHLDRVTPDSIGLRAAVLQEITRRVTLGSHLRKRGSVHR